MEQIKNRAIIYPQLGGYIMKYDDASYKEIRKLMDEKNFAKAKIVAQEYLEKYPNDNWTRLELVCILKEMNEIEASFLQIRYILNHLTEKDKKLSIDAYAILEIYNNYMYSEDYEKAFQYLKTVKAINKQLFKRNPLKLDELFLKKKTNQLDQIKIDEAHPYLSRQIISYSEEVALEHIIKNMGSLFEPEIDIEKLFHQIQSLLENSFFTQQENVIQKYYFEYPDVLNSILKEGYPYKYLTVTTIRGTKDIVEMAPKFSKNRIDVNLLEHKKVKHLS